MILRLLVISIFISVLYAEKPISEHLFPYNALLGKRYEGKYLNPQDEQLIKDVLLWERTLNGNAIKMTHSINNGEYGGITIIRWDPDENMIHSWYFDTGGSLTKSNIYFFNEKIISIEDVSNNKNGITKVKTSLEILDNDILFKKTKYLMKNIWVDGNEVFYRETKEFWPIFK